MNPSAPLSITPGLSAAASGLVAQIQSPYNTQYKSPIQPAQIVPPIGSQSSVNQPPPMQSSQIDPQVVAVANAIKNVESQGNYNALGDNGSSMGAYQWNNGPTPVAQGQTPKNWQAAAQKYLGSSSAPMTPANQNYVAYQQIAAYKAQGLTPDSIDALWNGATPSTTQPGQYTHINSQRATAFANALQNIVSGNSGANPTQPYQTPASTSGTGLGGIVGDVSSGNIKGVAEDVGNFAFPIVSDLASDFNGTSTKSSLQQLGDLGMSALWFLPFGDIAEGATDVARAGLGLAEGSEDTAAALAEAAPESAEAAENAAQVGKAATTASRIGNVATGLGVGYGANVASNLAQGQTGAAAFKPGLQTVIGGALPIAGEGLGSIYNKFFGQQSMVNQIQSAYEDAEGATKSGIKAASKVEGRGMQAMPEFLANAGILPETEELNGRRVFTTGADSQSQEIIQQRMSDLTNLRDQAIAKAGTNVPATSEDIRAAALAQATSEFSGTARDNAINRINQEFDSFKAQSAGGDGVTTLTGANEIKMALNKLAKYNATIDTASNRTNKIMASAAQKYVEDMAEENGLPGVGELNKIIGQHAEAIKFLDRINGQTIKGGRIGKYLSEGVGALVGNSVGNAVGGMVGAPSIGAGVGTLAGAGAGNLFSKFLQNFVSGGTISAAAIGRMAAQDPQVVQSFLDYLGPDAFDATEKIAPVLEPAQKSAAAGAQGLLQKTPGQAILNAIKAGYSPKEVEDYLNTTKS